MSNDYESIDRAIERIKRDRLSQPAESPEDVEQRVYLAMHGECQDRTERAFCKGMLVGGAIALAVFTITLKLVGVF